jgi:hypothetical protein
MDTIVSALSISVVCTVAYIAITYLRGLLKKISDVVDLQAAAGGVTEKNPE